jgi:2-amino-4-hydroxy-6-hydroxymethyldihydropteridine diphosphokinase
LNAANNQPKHRVCIGIGSNIRPKECVPKAIELLGEQVEIIAVSKVWETPPVGCQGCDNYLNAAALIETEFSPEPLRKEVLRRIESQLGRVRSEDKYAPRTIDLDILIFDDEICDTSLWRFSFLAVPVGEIMPHLVNPETGENIQDVATRLSQQTEITLRPEVLLS